jgi:hypothetical protein
VSDLACLGAAAEAPAAIVGAPLIFLLLASEIILAEAARFLLPPSEGTGATSTVIQLELPAPPEPPEPAEPPEPPDPPDPPELHVLAFGRACAPPFAGDDLLSPLPATFIFWQLLFGAVLCGLFVLLWLVLCELVVLLWLIFLVELFVLLWFILCELVVLRWLILHELLTLFDGLLVANLADTLFPCRVCVADCSSKSIIATGSAVASVTTTWCWCAM